MKIIPLVCPKCGGAINVTNKGSGVYQCPYCNTPIYFDDGVKREEKKVDINIKSDTIDRTTIQTNKDKLDFILKFCAMPLVVIFGFAIFCFIMSMLQ